jgi:hypothetical protein
VRHLLAYLAEDDNKENYRGHDEECDQELGEIPPVRSQSQSA